MARTELLGSIAQSPVEKGVESRLFQRAQIYLLGRFMLSDRVEYPCQTRDLSPGGALLYTPVQGRLGERVILYLQQIGRLEGVVVRLFRSGFAVEFQIPAIKRNKFADQIAWLTEQSSLGLRDLRLKPATSAQEFTNLLLVTGEAFQVEVIDVSMSGIAVAFNGMLPLGARLHVGNTPGRVVRNFEGGIAIEFRGIVTSSPDGAIRY
jgi:hypothetical protein